MHKNVHIIFHFISLFVLTCIRLIRDEKKQGPKPPPFSMLIPQKITPDKCDSSIDVLRGAKPALNLPQTLDRSLQISAGSALKLCAKMRCSLSGFWHKIEKKCQKGKIFSFGALLRHVDTIQKFALICAQFRILHT